MSSSAPATWTCDVGHGDVCDRCRAKGWAVTTKDALPRQIGTQAVAATPSALVMTAVVFALFGKRHDGPLAGAVKSMRTPGAGLPLESKTVARIAEPVAVASCEITANQLDLARQLGAIRISRQGADVRTAVKKLRDHLTADGSGRTGDEDSFHDCIVQVQNRSARCTKIRIRPRSKRE